MMKHAIELQWPKTSRHCKAAAKWYSETCIMQNYLKPRGDCKILINKRDYNKLNGKATAKDEDKNRIY